MSWLILAGAVLRMLMLGAKSLWYDEASTLLLSRLPLSHLVPTLVRDEGNPPLYAFLMHFWTPLFSDPRIGLRLFSVLCGVAALFAFRSLARRALPEKARALALCIAVFSSYWVHLAQDGRVYALLLLIALVEAVIVWDLSEQSTPRRWAAYAAVSVAGLYTHDYFAVVVAGHALWLLFRARRSRREMKSWALAHAAVAAAFLPWLPSLHAQVALHLHDAVLGEALTPRHLFDTVGTLFFDPTFLGLVLPSWLPVAIGVGAGVLLLFTVAKSRTAPAPTERRGLAFVSAGFFIPLALIAIVELVLRRPVTQARYFAPLSPFVYLSAASALTGTTPRRRAARIAALLVVAGGLVGYYVSAAYVDPRLDVLAAALRRTDSRLPVVYLGVYYYLPMRVYYLPERAQYLAAAGALDYDYADIAPYDGLMGRERLSRLGPCLVIDEARRFSKDLVFAATGRALAARVFPRP